MPARSIRAFLFDLDGVLVDTSRIVTRGWELFAAERGLSVPAEDSPRLATGRLSAELHTIEFVEHDRNLARKLGWSDARVASPVPVPRTQWFPRRRG